MRKLVQLLSRGFYTKGQENFHQIWAAFSQRPTADLQAMARMLATLVSPRTTVFLTQFTHPKASALNEWWQEDEGSFLTTIHEWTQLLTDLETKPPQKILVVGSYYFVATVQSRLRELGA